MKKLFIDGWVLQYEGQNIPAQVPGDITADLFRAGIVKDPYFGFNYKDAAWIAFHDFTYSAEIAIDNDILQQESVLLVFNGIDTFSSIYVNGKLLGHTDNMFLRYRYEIRGLLKKGLNLIEVKMRSTRREMENYDTSGYYATFNSQRLFVRKAQCHFGWDWAPDLCGYGIWEEVYLEIGDKCRIDDVYIVADAKGNVTFFTELNYNIKQRKNADGEVIEGSYIEEQNDILHYFVSDEPYGELFERKSSTVTGKKNFAGFTFEDVKLWWPNGYGEQPLYNYKIALERAGKIVYEKSGRFAFREIELVEEPKENEILGYSLKINGLEVFVKGSNWVPAECFTGVLREDKYRRLIDLARKGNFNMLRVWGGGIYEKETFYNLCDEMGIMVWQDMMFACADIPENNPEFVDNALKDVEYQVKRLRNHPSLVYWCGGNEKTGSYGLCITKGDFFTDCILRGVITKLDKTRPFASQSPCSWTDVGNDYTSGESHHNSFEKALVEGVKNYREFVAEKIVPFISEAALMGPNSVETTKKIYPPDKLWPMNEMWEDRLMKNPYSSVDLTFCERQRKYCSEVYGKAENLRDFTAKGMLVHAEAMRAEVEFARSNKGITSGFLNWMFDDIWPSGSWSIIDYWGEPKQVYYQMKKSYAPRLVTFVRNKKGVTELVVVNDLREPFTVTVRYGKKTLEGKVICKKEITVNNLVNGVFKSELGFDCDDKDTYLYAEYPENGEEKTTLYSSDFWSGKKFTADYEAIRTKINDCCIKVTIKAKSFAKSVFVSLKDNYKYTFSDNYIDVEAGTEKSIFITAEKPIDENEIVVTDFSEMTA